MYKLKKGQPGFEVVDGPMKGKKFEPGKVYKDIPPQERHRFEEVKKEKPKKAPPKKADKGQEADKCEI